MRDKRGSWTSLSEYSKVYVEEDKVHHHGDTEQVGATKQRMDEQISLQGEY